MQSLDYLLNSELAQRQVESVWLASKDLDVIHKKMADKRCIVRHVLFSLQNSLIVHNSLVDLTDRPSEGRPLVHSASSDSGSGSSSVVDERALSLSLSLTLAYTTEAIDEAQAAARHERSSIFKHAITQLHLSGAARCSSSTVTVTTRSSGCSRVETLLARLEPASQTASNALSSDSSGTPPALSDQNSDRSSNAPDSVLPRLSLNQFHMLPDIAAHQKSFVDAKASQPEAAAGQIVPCLMNKWRGVSSIANALGSLHRSLSSVY